MDFVARFSIRICWLFFCLPLCSSKKEIIGSVLEKGIQYLTIKGKGAAWDIKPGQSTAQTCGTGSPDDFWFVTKPVDLSSLYADVIYVDVDAEFKKCYDPSQSKRVPCVSNYYEVYIHYGKIDLGAKPVTVEGLLSVFSLVHNITTNSVSSTGTRINQTFFFKPKNTKEVTFAVRSTGACGSIFNMTTYYYHCEETYVNSVKLVKTSSPITGFKLVAANCSKNSLPAGNVTGREGRCYSNGSWIINEDFKCSCIEGYEPNKKRGCSLCNPNSFKQQVSNSKCIRCPPRRMSTWNRTSCRCGDGFYRSSSDVKNTSPCYAPLVLNERPKIEDNKTSVTIRWTKADATESLDEAIKYDVECFLCKDKNWKMCELSCENVVFNPGQINLVSTSVVVTNLQPGESYIFRVYPKNSLNDVIPKEEWKFIDTEMFTYQQKKETTPSRMIIIVTGVTAGLLLGVVLIVVLVKLKRRKRPLKLSTPVNIPLETTETSPESVTRSMQDVVTNTETSAKANAGHGYEVSANDEHYERVSKYESYEEPDISSQNLDYAELDRNRRRNSENDGEYQKLQKLDSDYVIPAHERPESACEYEDMKMGRNLPGYMELNQNKRETEESQSATYQSLN